MPSDLVTALALIPTDQAGPVFREPWEAQAFALVVALHNAGHFSWSEWVEVMSAEIRLAQDQGDPDVGDTYYRHWLAALEKIVLAKGLTDAVDLRLRRLECAFNTPTGHGHKAQREPVKIA